MHMLICSQNILLFIIFRTVVDSRSTEATGREALGKGELLGYNFEVKYKL